MIDRFRLFLGPARLRALFILIAVTGLASLMLNVVIDEYDWVRPVQSLLALIALVGAAIIIGGRLDPAERGRWLAILMPAVGALVLAGTVLTDFALPLAGAALGWIVAGLFLFRAKMPMAYQKAIRALRKADYETAVKVMDQIIKEEPDNSNHYRFRAELLRLWGKLDRARRDYVKITELDPASAVGFNGLAEVSLQAGDFQRAHEAALRAAALAPDDWVALYNLGMIEDRLRDSAAAIEHLSAALEQKVPDARHRLLIHFYLLRAYARTKQLEAAAEQLGKMQRLRSGLEEWQKILADDQAATLRAVLGADVELAAELIAGRMPIEAAAE
ncbi:MAG: tetratricopeptide repeat protein [Aggregatilineales bacterium]